MVSVTVKHSGSFRFSLLEVGVGGLVWGWIYFCQGDQEAGAGDPKEAPLPASTPPPSLVEGRE